jgi:hypothetical protein
MRPAEWLKVAEHLPSKPKAKCFRKKKKNH